jgi:hypothetical protein
MLTTAEAVAQYTARLRSVALDEIVGNDKAPRALLLLLKADG